VSAEDCHLPTNTYNLRPQKIPQVRMHLRASTRGGLQRRAQCRLLRRKLQHTFVWLEVVLCRMFICYCKFGLLCCRHTQYRIKFKSQSQYRQPNLEYEHPKKVWSVQGVHLRIQFQNMSVIRAVQCCAGKWEFFNFGRCETI